MVSAFIEVVFSSLHLVWVFPTPTVFLAGFYIFE